MRQTEFGGPLRFVLGELAEIIIETGGGTAVEPRPECRLADSLATGGRHPHIIISDPADHVGVRFDVAHESFCRLRFPSLPSFGPGAASGFGRGGGNWFRRGIT